MNKSEVIHELAIKHADTMSAKQLYSMCQHLSQDTPMSIVIEAIEKYFWDSIDEIDYTYVLQDYPP